MSKITDFFRQTPEFIGSFPTPSDIPASREPEIAFIGRSNVGKSSLINAIWRAPLAKTSNTPGRTQTLNFFRDKDLLMIVDLPGYGFAKAPPMVVKKWNENLRLYLRGRAQLKRVFLLIDSRQGLLDSDADMMKMLDDSAVSYQIVLTKVDKLKSYEEIQKKLTEIFNDHPAMHADVLATSSESGEGLDDIKQSVFNIV